MGAVIGWSIAVAVLLLILFAPVGIRLRVSDRGGCSDVGQKSDPCADERVPWCICLQILCFFLPLFPKKKKRPRLRDYRIKHLKKEGARLRRRQRRMEKRRARRLAKQKKRRAEEKKKKKLDKENKITDIPAMLRLVTRMLGAILPRTGKYFQIRIKRCTIRIGTGDAAQTAICYGTVSALLAQLFALLRSSQTVTKNAEKHVSLIADFSGRPSSFSCDIRATTSLFAFLRLFFRGAGIYLDEKVRQDAKRSDAQRAAKAAAEKKAREDILNELMGS